MNYIFYDLENLHGKGLEDIEKFNKKDTLFIFYSKNKNILNIDLIEKLRSSKIQTKYVKSIYSSKNSLDFILVFYLGICTGRKRHGNFIVLSKDNDFKQVIEKGNQSSLLFPSRLFQFDSVSDFIKYSESKPSIVKLIINKIIGGLS